MMLYMLTVKMFPEENILTMHEVIKGFWHEATAEDVSGGQLLGQDLLEVCTWRLAAVFRLQSLTDLSTVLPMEEPTHQIGSWVNLGISEVGFVYAKLDSVGGHAKSYIKWKFWVRCEDKQIDGYPVHISKRSKSALYFALIFPNPCRWLWLTALSVILAF
jgi:hypothetical protein